jgi:D-hexose-6-phosphate mutarotase
VNMRADFEALRKVDINVALIAWHDEAGSLGEAADTLWKRYFCVETGYEDEQAREKIMQIIREILVPQK